ncbi:transcription factor bHLH27-like [Aristolochia californica]|uniref:transcription factor bHLH27-like n=1 Tax=Aristolochia californica TaxID=171875 RepID=UPI0035DA8942
MEDLEDFLMERIPEFQVDSGFDAWCHFQLSEMYGFDIMSDFSIGSANLLPDINEFNTESANQQQEEQQEPKLQEKQNESNLDDKDRKEEEQTKSCRNPLVSHWEEMDVDEEGEEDEMKTDDTKKANGLSCKNLISERNRRKRINQQLLTLMSVVPDIKKMSKRAVLEESLAYLQFILQQTEIEQRRANNNSKHIPGKNSGFVSDNLPPAQVKETTRPCITEIEVERMDDAHFILKTIYDEGKGGLVQMQRAIESLGLGLETTCVSVNQFRQGYMLTTAFLRAKRRGVVTEEKLKHRFKVTAIRMGFRLQDP